MFKSLKTLFISFTTVLILVTVGIPTYVLISKLRDNFQETYNYMVKLTVDMIRCDISHAMMDGKPEKLSFFVNKISQLSSVYRVSIINPEGVVTHSNHTSVISKNINDVQDHENLTIEPDTSLTQFYHNGSVYSAMFPIINKKECHTCHDAGKKIIGFVDVDLNLTKAEYRFRDTVRMTLVSGVLLILILGSVLYIMFNRYINRPIKDLAGAMDEVEKGNFTVRLYVSRSAEIKTLQNQFNHMVKKLDESRKKIDDYHLEQLQRADRLVTLGELTAELAHEINNPSGIILTRADYLRSVFHDLDNYKEYEEDLDAIVNQIEKVSKITSSILKYSRKLPKNFQSINLKETLLESLKVLQPRLDKYDIKVNIIDDGGDWIRWGEAMQMEQAFTNLINNAVDASGKGSSIDVIFKHKEHENGKIIEIEINDNGSGIGPKNIYQIFEPFYSSKPPGKGTGLGLYIVNNIIKNHNGKIEVSSELDKGTSFKITFPAD
ncbi:MAG: sensor histidine kinase [Calditrichaceae bacterium]